MALVFLRMMEQESIGVIHAMINILIITIIPKFIKINRQH